MFIGIDHDNCLYSCVQEKLSLSDKNVMREENNNNDITDQL